jgi:hypothetical protein
MTLEIQVLTWDRHRHVVILVTAKLRNSFEHIKESYLIFDCMCMFSRLLFVRFLLVIVLSVLRRFTDSDYLPLVSSNSSSDIPR